MTDRTDPQIVHLDGLNLSRAWCMRSIAAALPKDDPARKVLAESAARHAEAALQPRRQRRLCRRALAGVVRGVPALDAGAGVTDRLNGQTAQASLRPRPQAVMVR